MIPRETVVSALGSAFRGRAFVDFTLGKPCDFCGQPLTATDRAFPCYDIERSMYILGCSRSAIISSGCAHGGRRTDDKA